MTAEKLHGQMAHIPASSLRSLPQRISYLSSFLSFGPTDGLAIQASGAHIAPQIPTALDLVYAKLLSYDITAKAFVPRQGGAENGPTPAPARPQDLSLTHAHILLRKDFLKDYLLRIVSNEDWTPSSALWDYLDHIGVAHTGAPPGKKRGPKTPGSRVELMHMSLLLGFVQDVIVSLVLATEALDASAKNPVIRAWNKLLWMQNDLFARHYVVDDDDFNNEDNGAEFPRGGAGWIGDWRKGAVVWGALGMLGGIALSAGYASWA